MANNIENNKLITGFMGFSEVQEGTYKVQLPVKYGFLRARDMKFHTSWDWLMPVVEKIESINKKNDEYYTDYVFQTTNFVTNYTASFLDRNNLDVAQAEGTNKLEATYKAVVEFINWNNENKED